MSVGLDGLSADSATGAAASTVPTCFVAAPLSDALFDPLAATDGAAAQISVNRAAGGPIGLA